MKTAIANTGFPTTWRHHRQDVYCVRTACNGLNSIQRRCSMTEIKPIQASDAYAPASEPGVGKTASLLIVDSYPPLGLLPNSGILHANAVKNAVETLLDSMCEAQSVLQHRDAFEVAVACTEGGNNCLRITHIIESTVLRDARNKLAAVRRLRFAFPDGRHFRDRADCHAYAQAFFAEVLSYAKRFADVNSTAVVRATVVTSCSVAEVLKKCVDRGSAVLNCRGDALRFRFFSLVPSRTSSPVDVNKEQPSAHCEVHEVQNYTASISWAFRSILGDALESRGMLKIRSTNGRETLKLHLSVRPRLVCTLGAAPLYNSRVALPGYVTIEAMQRICVESVSEDVLLGVPHIVSACADCGTGSVQLARLIQGLQQRKEMLLVEIDAAGPFQKRFGVLVPSRTTRFDVLLLREVACAETIVPLGIWHGASIDGSEGLAGGEDADEATRQIAQVSFSPPVRRSST